MPTTRVLTTRINRIRFLKGVKKGSKVGFYNIRALIILIGFWGPLLFLIRNPPKQLLFLIRNPQNNMGKYLGHYST